MHIRTKAPTLRTLSTETSEPDALRMGAFELTETIQGLMDAIHNGIDLGVVDQMAMKALSVAERTEWRVCEQGRQIAELERDAVTDPLTGVLNRRGFEAELARALADGRRYDEHGALIYLDMDGFKQINDTLGHSAGDAVLCKFASILSNNVRDTDRIGRLGGDEFAVLMSRTTVENATVRAEKIDQIIKVSAIDWHGQMISIRASMGTDYFGPNDDSSAVIIRADQNMYRQKQERRRFPRPASQSNPLFENKNDGAIIPITSMATIPVG